LIDIFDKFTDILGKGNNSNVSALSKSICCSDPQEKSSARRNVKYTVAN